MKNISMFVIMVQSSNCFRFAVTYQK